MIAWFLNILALLFLWLSPPAFDAGRAPIISPRSDAPALRLDASRSAALIANDRVFLWQDRAEESQPIASITKLMTALVFLDNNPGWDSVYKVSPAESVEGGRLNLFTGDRVKVKDLFYTSLVASDNGATLALARSTGLTDEEFVRRMNAKAAAMGLMNTRFEDPIGLGNGNLSTAREVALLAQTALKNEAIREATTKSSYSFTTLEGREKNLDSTDYLLLKDGPKHLKIRGGKTGYTDRAGYCFVGLFRDESGRELVAAVLNSSGKNDRFLAARKLAEWAFDNFKW